MTSSLSIIISSSSSSSSSTLNTSQPLAASELAQACGAQVDWVLELVEVGIIESHSPAERPEDWRFHDQDLRCALEARRLQRDFGVELDAAALIIDLAHELRRLKSLLRAQGLGHEV